MRDFLDKHRDRYGVEPICARLPIALSTYYEHKARKANLERWPRRARCDAQLKQAIRRVWEDNLKVYGVRKVWRPRGREAITVARCTVARLMREQLAVESSEMKGLIPGFSGSDPGVDPVGVGKVAHGVGESTRLARIDDGDGDTCRLQQAG